MSTDCWLNKTNEEYIHDGILFSHTMNEICNSLDTTESYVKWNKPGP